ncbi:MAG: hypothetical protein ACRETC_10665 [Gammaproteobacteria bacterium]
MVIIHTNTKQTDFPTTEFAKSIGYAGDPSAMNLAGLTAELESKSGQPVKEVPPKAHVAFEMGVSGKHLTSSFDIVYEKSKGAYVWSDASEVKSWFVESNNNVGSLANASLTATIEGFEKYPDIAGFTIKNKGDMIANVMH